MITQQRPGNGRRRGIFGTGWRGVVRVLVVGFVVLMVPSLWLAAPDAEGHRETEAADIARLTQDMLTIQSRYAAEQNRPLARGTHAKGVCVNAQFTVNDLAATVPDQALASRLAKGLYAHAAAYPALVRFANGESHIYPDAHKDVRAMSFSVDLAGRTASRTGRQDYAMNNATTFPLNDAHEFASATRVATASSPGAGIWSLPFRDKFGFARIAVLGFQQQKPPAASYQQTRYWSTVPYAHGAGDVVKYSAIPCGSNQSRPFGTGPNFLQDELARTVNDDAPAACFDFALQILDAERMTRWGLRRSRNYWIENASVEWDEDEAPFHVVGRLTLTPKGMVAASTCEAQHIDVTENSTADTKPLGSINRARWGAEAASRKARLAR